MKIYSSIDSVPELRDLPRHEKRLLHREAVFGMRFLWRSVAANSLAIGVMLLLWTMTPRLPPPAGYVCVAIGLVFACFVLGQVSIQIERPLLRRLRDRHFGENGAVRDAPLFD